MNAPTVPTAADLKALFAAKGVRPNRGRGQNFLIDPASMRFVADAACLSPDVVVLEPGPGTGGLTRLLAERAGVVIAVEIDRKLRQIAAAQLRDLENVLVLHADILGKGDVLNPVVRETVEQALRARPGAAFKVVANLPYRVSTALIAALLTDGPVPDEIVAMAQREVAERLRAAPGSPDYGYLSVIVQAAATVERLRTLGPSAFWPQPEVDSAVVRVTAKGVTPSASLRRVAGALFTHRRKKAARGLVMAGIAPDMDTAEKALEAAGVPPDARPERITVEQFLRLARWAAAGGDRTG